MNKLLRLTKEYYILLISGSLWWKTSIIMQNEDFVGWINVTKCCKVCPITSEKYCPECGKRIVK